MRKRDGGDSLEGGRSAIAMEAANPRCCGRPASGKISTKASGASSKKRSLFYIQSRDGTERASAKGARLHYVSGEEKDAKYGMGMGDGCWKSRPFAEKNRLGLKADDTAGPSAGDGRHILPEHSFSSGIPPAGRGLLCESKFRRRWRKVAAKGFLAGRSDFLAGRQRRGRSLTGRLAPRYVSYGAESPKRRTVRWALERNEGPAQSWDF